MWTSQLDVGLWGRGIRWWKAKCPDDFSHDQRSLSSLWKWLPTFLAYQSSVHLLLFEYMLPILGERKVVKLSIVSTAGQGQLKKEDKGIVKWIQESIIGLVSALVSSSQAEVRNTPTQSRGQMQDAELRFVAIKLKGGGNLLDFRIRRHREEGMGIWNSEGRWAHAKSFGENGCLDFHWT